MKRTAACIATLSVLLAGCGESKYFEVNGKHKEYPTYGFVNEKTNKSKNVCYEISVGNIVWSVILIETIVAPAYFIGWSLYNPIRLKHGQEDECSFDSI